MAGSTIFFAMNRFILLDVGPEGCKLPVVLSLAMPHPFRYYAKALHAFWEAIHLQQFARAPALYLTTFISTILEHLFTEPN